MVMSCFVHGHDEEMFFEFMRINDYSFQLKKNFFLDKLYQIKQEIKKFMKVCGNSSLFN